MASKSKGGLKAAAVAGLGAGISIKVIEDFVAALNPSQVQQFDDALREVKATIAQALQPILETLTELFRDFAAIFDDTFKQLGEIIKTLLDALKPFITIILQVVNAALQPLLVIVQMVADTFVMLLKATVLVTAELMRLAGARETLAGFIKLFEDQLNPANTANAAPRDVGIKSVDQIVKDLATAAANAGAGRSDNEFLKDIVDKLKEIEKGAGLGTVLMSVLDEWWAKIWKDIKEAFMPNPGGWRDRQAEWLANQGWFKGIVQFGDNLFGK